MHIYRELFDSLRGDFMSKANSLYSEKKYKECIELLDKSEYASKQGLIRTMIEPESVDLERSWLRANSYFHLKEYNPCLRDIKYLSNYPSNNSSVENYKRLASNLQSSVLKEMEKLSEFEVKYPIKSFTEIFTKADNTSNEDIIEIQYEGIQKSGGNYYIKVGSVKANSNTRLTIYISPITESEVIIFGYVSELNEINKLINDDPIYYHAIINKLPILQKMKKDGENGPIEKCAVFNTIDWARLSTELLTPVVGFKCDVDINKQNIEELFEMGVKNIAESANIILKELRDNKLTTSDKIFIYGEAFTIGALSTVIGREFGRDVSKTYKEAINALFRNK